MVYMALIEDEEQRRRFLRLYEQYHAKMMAVAYKHFPGDRHAAEDAVHESFLRIIENFEKISEISCDEIGSYIVTIVKHVCLDMLKKQRRLVLTDDFTPYERADIAPPENRYGRIVAIIRTMPETYRAALEMRFILEQDYETIAKALGITLSAAKSRISRGRQLLEERLREEGFEP